MDEMNSTESTEAAPFTAKRTALERYTALCAADHRRREAGIAPIPGEAWYTVCHQLIGQAQDAIDRAQTTGTERSLRRLNAACAISTADRAYDAACRADIDHEGMTHGRIRQLRLQASRTHASLS